MKNLFFLLTCTLFLSCTKLPATPSTSTAEEKRNSNTELKDIKRCVCVQMWMPVCGKDKKTYSNACFADCAGVDYSMGSCEQTE